MIRANCTISVQRYPDGNSALSAVAVLSLQAVRAQWVPPSSELITALGTEALPQLRVARVAGISPDIRPGDVVQLVSHDDYSTLPPYFAKAFTVKFTNPRSGIADPQIFLHSDVVR